MNSGGGSDAEKIDTAKNRSRAHRKLFNANTSDVIEYSQTNGVNAYKVEEAIMANGIRDVAKDEVSPPASALGNTQSNNFCDVLPINTAANAPRIAHMLLTLQAGEES